MCRLLEATDENISETAKIILKGGIIAYPTDTVYGLGCAPFNLASVERILRVKGDRTKPLPILAYDVGNAERIAFFSRMEKKLADRFWPGPLTIVLRRRKTLPAEVSLGLGTVGVRVPNHRVAAELIRLSGGLLVGTSANLAGGSSPTEAREVVDQLGSLVDLVLDGGETLLKKGSTVVRVLGGEIRVLRPGPIGESELTSL